ncbi:MAG: Holliday junction branch migration protein RuvA [Microcella sp.]|uniref:Holliday junction branch migration protein RuvA n=1 Tax=Microcella sp. TaxID=1913979 RepID=UPI0024C95256|nr:Holliday junction branch migration protein RuvA [Microcella sp.]UYN84183.1 MAG: Holliday junction branch migration protein RuvA [Microcella sp.]
MIASLRGTVVALGGSRAVIDVGGVGYAVTLTERHARELHIADSVLVHTALIVREDDMSLFGFVDEIELGLFELLRSVSGVGPKSAMGVLSAMTPDSIARAITDDDDAPFRAVSGIGPKTAKLIVVSLAGKLMAPAAAKTAAQDAPQSASPSTEAALVAALTGLGWPERTALDAARTVVADEPQAESAALPVLLRRALSLLGPGHSRGDVVRGDRS